jgi:gliding motility-associated-like protein
MFMKKISCIIFILASSIFCVYSQNEGNIWYFGEGAGLDFNSGIPVPLTDGMIYTIEGCASISDNNGDLLFYTDGMVIYNRNHTIMPNGAGLLGNNSSTQSAIIVKKPASTTIYYIFTVDGASGIWGGLTYSEVDMSLDGGFGDVNINKNIELFPTACEKVTAILHQNGSDFWIVSRLENSNTYHSYLLSSAGLDIVPMISNIGAVLNGTGGYLRGSPDGSRIAAVFCWSNVAIELYDFDNLTGVLSNLVPINTNQYEYGVEFSASGNILYTGAEGTGGIYQYNLLAGSSIDIENSEVFIGSSSGHALQTGPDGKIYAATWGSASLGRINNPDILGLGCSYIPNSVDLNGRFSKAGLPTFYSSIFLSNTVDVGNLCFGDTTYFTSTNTSLDSLIWNFGDMNSGQNNTSTDTNTHHIFSDTGNFDVILYSYLNGLVDTSITSIYINSLPSVNLGVDTSICNGDILLLDAGLQQGYSYLWNDNSILSNSNVSAFGSYFVFVTDSNGCINSDTINVLLNPLPYVNLGDDIEICDGYSIMLESTLVGASYLWGNNSTDAIYEVVSSGDYFVVITDSNGCINSDTVNIIIHPDPNSDFTFDPQPANLNNPIILFSHIPSINTTVYWNLGDSTTLEDIYDFYHTYQSSGNYDVTLIALSGFGCTDTTIYQIIIDPATFTLFIPNSFTPNNDEHNELFVIKGVGIIEFNIKIFNPWGNKLFESNRLDKYWDGSFEGSIVQQDKYTYLVTVLDLNGDIHEFPGTVYVIK